MSKRHLTRKQLIAVATGSLTHYRDHLEICRDCRQAVELFKAFPVAGRLMLSEPPAGWVEFAKAIPRRTGLAAHLQTLRAIVTFDSWMSPALQGVRGPGITGERRACFKAGEWIVDLRAEKRRTYWSMVAQLAGSDRSRIVEAILVAGKTTVVCDAHGVFQWTSIRPPMKLSLRAGGYLIELPGLPWKRRMKK